jgi:hypothetical protein
VIGQGIASADTVSAPANAPVIACRLLRVTMTSQQWGRARTSLAPGCGQKFWSPPERR